MMGGGVTLAGVQDCSADRGHVQMARRPGFDDSIAYPLENKRNVTVVKRSEILIYITRSIALRLIRMIVASRDREDAGAPAVPGGCIGFGITAGAAVESWAPRSARARWLPPPPSAPPCRSARLPRGLTLRPKS